MSREMTIRLGAGQRVSAHYDDFVIETDQPEKSGGDASAPAPFDLFLASLGTCAGFYVKKFCEKRDIASAGIEIHQRWEREDKRLSRVIVEIRLPASFPEKYREAVVRAADQCAVKKSLADPPEIVTEAVLRS